MNAAATYLANLAWMLTARRVGDEQAEDRITDELDEQGAAIPAAELPYVNRVSRLWLIEHLGPDSPVIIPADSPALAVPS